MRKIINVILRMTAMVLSLCTLTACGQTGPLYIEKKPADITYPTPAGQITPSSEVTPSDDS